MPEAAYDVRRPNVSPMRQDSRVRMIWRLYRREDLTDLGAVITGPIGFLNTAAEGLRAGRDFIRSLRLPTPRGRGRLVKEIRSVLLLHEIAMDTDVRSSFSYVRDGSPGENFFIDMPFRNAKGVTHVRLGGRTFRGPIVVNGVAVDGQAALNEFEKLFEDYLNPRIGTPADYRLYWLNLDAPVSAEDPFGASEWWIHPPRRAVRKTKSVSRPFDWNWSLDFLALQSNRDVAKSEDGFLASLFGTSALRALLERLQLDVIVDGIRQVFGLVDEFRGLIDDAIAVVVAATDYVTGVQQLIRASVAKVRAVLNGINELIARIEDGIEQVRNLPNMLADEVALIRQSIPGLVEDEVNGVVLADDLRNVRDAALAMLAQPQHFHELVGGSPPLPQTITVRIQPGITIERLAHDSRASVDALIEVNGLEYPFIDARERPVARVARYVAEQAAFQAADAARISQGLQPQHAEEIAQLGKLIEVGFVEAFTDPPMPGVLYAGDPIRLPQDRPEIIPSVVGIDGGRLNVIATAIGALEVNEEERIFGIDLALSERGDLEWDPERFDLRVERGLDNIRAALARYLELPLGALRFAPEIGNFAYEDLSRWQTGAESRLLSFSIQQTLAQDPRVRRVNDVWATTEGGVTQLHFDADLIDGRHLPDLRAALPEAA